MNDVQPVIQVLAERFFGDEIDQPAMGRGDDAHVDVRHLPVGAHALNLAGLEESKQQRLHPQTHLADFVHEDGAAMGALEPAGLVAMRIRETAFDVTEQFGFQKRSGMPAQLIATVVRCVCGSADLNEARNHFLADAALAGDKVLGAGARRVVDLFWNEAGCAACADELVWGSTFRRRGLEQVCYHRAQR